ncbi:9937_t:CDS:1, partial [Acaulospora morrowiae]
MTKQTMEKNQQILLALGHGVKGVIENARPECEHIITDTTKGKIDKIQEINDKILLDAQRWNELNLLEKLLVKLKIKFRVVHIMILGISLKKSFKKDIFKRQLEENMIKMQEFLNDSEENIQEELEKERELTIEEWYQAFRE